jgi:hypothetical protein
VAAVPWPTRKRGCKTGLMAFSGTPEQEFGMKWTNRIRQAHRWLSIIFTATVIANFAVRAAGTPPDWVTYSPLPSLFLMLFSGLYMFALPYANKWRGRANVLPGA